MRQNSELGIANPLENTWSRNFDDGKIAGRTLVQMARTSWWSGTGNSGAFSDAEMHVIRPITSELTHTHGRQRSIAAQFELKKSPARRFRSPQTDRLQQIASGWNSIASNTSNTKGRTWQKRENVFLFFCSFFRCCCRVSLSLFCDLSLSCVFATARTALIDRLL